MTIRLLSVSFMLFLSVNAGASDSEPLQQNSVLSLKHMAALVAIRSGEIDLNPTTRTLTLQKGSTGNFNPTILEDIRGWVCEIVLDRAENFLNSPEGVRAIKYFKDTTNIPNEVFRFTAGLDTSISAPGYIQLQRDISPDLRSILNAYKVVLDKYDSIDCLDRLFFLQCLTVDRCQKVKKNDLTGYASLQLKYVSPLILSSDINCLYLEYDLHDFPSLLAQQTTIKDLSISKTDFRRESSLLALYQFGQLCDNLKGLSFKDAQVHENLWMVLRLMPQLTRFYMDNVMVEGDVNVLIKNMPTQLTFLNLNSLGLKNMPELPAMPDMFHLDLRRKDLDYPEKFFGLVSEKFVGLYTKVNADDGRFLGPRIFPPLEQFFHF